MPGYLALVLHAHLPFVRHPEHERFLEESWLYEAITETYLPLLELIEGWQRDRLNVRLTLSLSPTLCSMLLDPLLQSRYERHLLTRIELAEKETFRTHWDRLLKPLAEEYVERFKRLRELYLAHDRNLVTAFSRLQQQGRLEIITCAATHAVLPLLADHPPSLRGQVLVARDHYRACFGRDPVGIWLPECGYCPEVEPVLHEANLRWFIVDTHGVLNSSPRPRFGVYAPVFTGNGLAVFGRESETARLVWSREAGFPGDPRYRDFYRDIGHDLELDYVQPYLPSPGERGFTGIKYYRITGSDEVKEVYDPALALAATREHAEQLLAVCVDKLRRVEDVIDRPPLITAPYDAELFGHWWHEGPQFLDALVREALDGGMDLSFITPTDYLRRHPTNQVVRPASSTWGEGGHLKVWLNEENDWIQGHLRRAQEQFTDLARRHLEADELTTRALHQCARELMLAQSSDWPFILHTGTSPAYAVQRVQLHLQRFWDLHHQANTGQINPAVLGAIEVQDNIFPKLNHLYWT